MNKWIKFVMVPLVVVALGATIAGCSAKSSTNSSTQQISYTVRKGTVAQQITAVGNVNYSNEQELSFDTGGTLYQVSVAAGDTVTKGEVLAQLDTTQWQQSVNSLKERLEATEVALSQAQQTETQAIQGVTTAQNGVTTAQNTLAGDQAALTQAQNKLQNDQAQAQQTIANDQLTVKEAQYAFDTNTGGTFASDKLALANQQLALNQTSTQNTVADDNNAITTDNNKITSDQAALQTAQNGVNNAQASLDIGKLSLANAQQSVTDAQTNLDQANATSPEITAPFDGLIISVNSSAGTGASSPGQVFKGETIVTEVDPTQFEADVSIGESNISQVNIGGSATIQFDALPGVMLPGKITTIAPTSTTSQGVVTYAVTVNVESLQNLAGRASGVNSQGPPPNGSAPPTGFTPPPGFTPPIGNGTAPGSGANPSASSQSVQLKQGMTATVNITYASATNVIVVPNQAITTTGNQPTVNVLKNGVITKTPVQTSISNSNLTEVTSGINVGDTVVYTRTVSSSSSSSGPGGFPGGGFGGGLGGGLGGGGRGVIRGG